MENNRKRQWLTAAVLAVVVLGVMGVAWFLLGEPKAQVTVSAQSDDGVEPDTFFTVTLPYDTTADELRGRLVTEPPTAFQLEETSAREFVLQPFYPLAPGEEFLLRVAAPSGKEQEFRWQVANRLLVRSHYPADGAEKVPQRAGIELRLNTADIAVPVFEAAIDIQPPVEGDIRIGDGRLVFSPVDGFAYDTAYTVTLGEELVSDGGAKQREPLVFHFTTISEEEESAGHSFTLTNDGACVNTLPDETVLLGAYVDEGITGDDRMVDVTIYRYDTAAAYTDALRESQQRRKEYFSTAEIDTSGLTQYAAFEVQPIAPMADATNFWNQNDVLQFPEPLPVGWYAADLSVSVQGTTVTRQVFLQSSDLSVFFMSLDDELIAWVNDTATGQPVEGARFAVSDSYNAVGTTGADGTARLEKAVFAAVEEKDDRLASVRLPAIFTVTAGDRTFVDGSAFESGDDWDSRHGYYAYLFTDRPIYRTTDTIKAWGMVRPRDGSQPLPSGLTLQVADDGNEVPVTLLPNGTFTAELKLENRSSDWTSLKLQLDDERVLTDESLRIEDYVKPIYIAETQVDKPVYLLRDDDAARVTLTVSTFDGTPAATFPVNFDGWSAGMERADDAPLVTDENGVLGVPLRLSSNVDSWRPQSLSYQFTNAQAESEFFYEYGSVNLISRDLMLRAERRDDDAIEVRTNRIDISRITDEAMLWDVDALTGAPVTAEVTAEVWRIYYTRETQGSYYNFITRQREDSYYYNRHEDLEDTLTFSTTGGQYTLKDLPKSDEDSCYYLVLTTPDSQGEPVRERIYLGLISERSTVNSDGLHRYGLNKLTNAVPPDAQTMESYELEWEMQQLRAQFMDNENITFQLEDNGEAVADFQGRLLYVVAQADFGQTNIVTAPQLVLPYAEELLPNYLLTGAYFDGRHIYSLYDKSMSYDPVQRELELEISPSLTQFAPGDTVEARVTVKNKYTGQTVPDATVLLAAVDEAVFAVQEQYPNMLEEIYRDSFYPQVKKYVSYVQISYGGGGEKGGGGGDGETRRDFSDTACFITAQTDAAGVATLSFKLPDSLTAWRLTALSLTDNLWAGDNKTKIYATLPFFVQPIVNSELLAGDDCSVSLRAAGTAITSESTVDYEVRVTGNGYDKTKKRSGAARAYNNVTFNDLPLGDYKVTVSGTSGGHRDALELPFTVRKSGVELSLVKNFDLREGITVEPLRFPVTVALYDKGYRNYSAVFANVACQSGVRADMRMAARFAAQSLADAGAEYDEDALKDNLSNLSGSRVRMFPDSAIDVELTVMAHMVLPEMFDKDHSELKGITLTDMEQSEGRSSVLYLARALTGEPFGADLGQMLANETDFDFLDKMNLASALALAGDRDGAQKAYDTLVTPYLVTQESVSGVRVSYVKVPEANFNVPEWTAAATVLASLLGTDDAHALARYLVEYPSKYDTFLMEQMIYLKYYAQPADGVSAKVSYQLDGKRETVELGRKITYLTLDAQQLAAANFKTEAGEAFADVFYIGSPEQTASVEQKQITLTKRIESADGGPIRQGSLVKITLQPKFTGLDTTLGDTCMVVDDYIPAGMRFERYSPQTYNEAMSSNWYLDKREGQRVRFSVWGGRNDWSRPVTYYARCALPGDYVVESAHVASKVSAIWGASERQRVRIDP